LKSFANSKNCMRSRWLPRKRTISKRKKKTKQSRPASAGNNARPGGKAGEKGGEEMFIGVVLTCTTHGEPIWLIYDVNQESPEDVLVDRSVNNPPPYRVIGPYEVSSDDETVVKEAVANDPNESVDLDNPRTWFPEEDWINRYLMS